MKGLPKEHKKEIGMRPIVNGNIPRMKGLPKKHKKEIGMRPMVNEKGTILEELEAEMAEVLKSTGNTTRKGNVKEQ